MQIRKILSSSSTAMNLGLAFICAWLYGYDGVEVVPHRFVTAKGLRKLEQRYGIPVTAIHLSWWTWRGAWFWLGPRSTWRCLKKEWAKVGGNVVVGYMNTTLTALIYDFFINKLQTLTWLLIMGPLDGPLCNPGLKLARELGVPVVIHAGPILELVRPPNEWPSDPEERAQWKQWIHDQLAIFDGIVEVRVENNDAPFHPDSKGGEWMEAAKFCLQLLQKFGGHSNAKLAFDGEHLAKETGFWDLMSLERKLLPVLRDLPRASVVEAHICGYDPEVGGVKKGGHLPLDAGSFPIKHNLLALLQTGASSPNSLLEVVVETPPGIGDFLKLLFFGKHAGKAYGDLLCQQMCNKAFLNKIA